MFGRQKMTGVETEKTNDIGFNMTSALAYYIESINSTVLFGGRYQYIRSKYSGDTETTGTGFWGLTLAMVYHFGMGE